jgi:hypothetical protein
LIGNQTLQDHFGLDSISALPPPPYSLGKLIDWKLECLVIRKGLQYSSPYSLGKLIDWKPHLAGFIPSVVLSFTTSNSLLVREIN